MLKQATTGHHENEREEEIGHEFLDVHDLECVGLLLIAVEHLVAALGQLLKLLLRADKIGPGLKSEFQRRHAPLLAEEVAGQRDGDDNIAFVVAALHHVEKHTGRHHGVGNEAGRHHGVVLSFAHGSVKTEVSVPVVTHIEILCQSDAQNTVLKIGCMEREISVATQHLIEVGKFIEVILHALHRHHRLMAVIDGERLVLHALRSHGHVGIGFHLREDRVVGRSRLALHRHHLELRVDVGEE